MSKPVRVLVVDDSALMRKMIPQILERDSSIQVVGTAMDGSFGLKKIAELRPDVVTIDLDMPRMDGMEMLRQITRIHRIPSIIVSAHSTTGASATCAAQRRRPFWSVRTGSASRKRANGLTTVGLRPWRLTYGQPCWGFSFGLLSAGMD